MESDVRTKILARLAERGLSIRSLTTKRWSFTTMRKRTLRPHKAMPWTLRN